MANNRFPTVGSGRLKEGGRLATDKQDFNAHVEGNVFRHTADQIDMSPPIAILGSGTTVQQTLQELQTQVASTGSGFISIGNAGSDGYALGSYNVGSIATPSFNDAMQAALADRRLQNGGVILVMAGTYHVFHPVVLPAGITVMGELGGTILVSETTEQSLFVVDFDHKTLNIGGNSGGGTIPLITGSNVEETKFYNIILTDNFDGYANAGQPSMTTVPIIQCRVGSNVACERVSFIGRLHSGSVSARQKTRSAVAYISGGGGGSTLTIRDCFFDGFRVAVEFTPGNNANDFLTVTGCKARTYGTEDSGSTSAALNCFLNISHCNANITDNYYVGAGTYTNTFLCISSGSGASVKVVVSGNSGGPTTPNSGNLINNVSGSTFVSSLGTNNWGFQTDNPWYITVGGSAGTTPVGDFFGPGAVDTVLGLANSISNFKATVIINPGTYTVTGNATATNNFANLRFIGNKIGNAYPILNLSLTSSTLDNLQNRPLTLGNYLESIQFTSVGHRHSIRPAFNPAINGNTQTGGGTIEVKDCFFNNTSLFFQELGTPPLKTSSLDPISAKILVKACHFLQTGTFIDSFSLVAPGVDLVHISDSFFMGNGYAVSVGIAGYNASISGSVVLSDVTCSMVNPSTFENYTISGQAFHSGPTNPFTNNYIAISSMQKADLLNVQVYVGSGFSQGSPNATIAAGLTSAGDFIHFISLTAEMVNVDNCVLTGPPQTTTISAVDYAIPTLFIDAASGGRITNSKFAVGALSILVAGSTLTDDGFTDRFIIENCGIQSMGQTAVSFELYLPDQSYQPKVSILNCNIQGGSTPMQVNHLIFDPEASATVQLMIGNGDVNVSGNTITSILSEVTGSNITKYAGLFIDNQSTTGTAQVNTTHVSSNTIHVQNSFNSSNVPDNASCLYLYGAALQIHDNFLAMANTASGGASFAGCAYIRNSPVNSYSEAMVSGNTFSRNDILGTATNLLRGYISIDSTTTNKGSIINNIFSSETYDLAGVLFTLVEDNTTVKWNIYGNKNQTGTQTIPWALGQYSVSTSSTNNIMAGGATSTSTIQTVDTNGSNVTFNYATTGTTITFVWGLPLQGILPYGVTIDAVNYSYQFSAVPSTKSIAATLHGAAGNSVDNPTISGTSLVNRSITLAHTYSLVSTDNIYLTIKSTLEDGSVPCTLNLGVTVKYHW